MAKEDQICKRCGACCHYTAPDGSRKACRYLITLSSGSTLCRVYKTRLGRVVGLAEHGKIYCAPREAHGIEPGCPLNPV